MSDIQSPFHRIQLVRKRFHRIYRWRKQAAVRREAHSRGRELQRQPASKAQR